MIKYNDIECKNIYHIACKGFYIQSALGDNSDVCLCSFFVSISYTYHVKINEERLALRAANDELKQKPTMKKEILWQKNPKDSYIDSKTKRLHAGQQLR